MSRITTGLLANEDELKMAKKRIKKADGGMTGGPSSPVRPGPGMTGGPSSPVSGGNPGGISYRPGMRPPVARPGRPIEGGSGGRTPVPVGLKKGGNVEGSAKDTREDKAMAKKRGMSMSQWEASAADVKHDMPMKKRGGGIAQRGKGIALRGGGIAKRGMGIALKKGGKVRSK